VVVAAVPSVVPVALVPVAEVSVDIVSVPVAVVSVLTAVSVLIAAVSAAVAEVSMAVSVAASSFLQATAATRRSMHRNVTNFFIFSPSNSCE
jgi:hypothetical protein